MNAGIELRLSERGVSILDRRADVTPVLRTLPVEQALAMIPSLLPVCARAQRIAAERAIESARGLAASAQTEAARECELLREQAYPPSSRRRPNSGWMATSAGQVYRFNGTLESL